MMTRATTYIQHFSGTALLLGEKSNSANLSDPVFFSGVSEEIYGGSHC